MTADSPRPSALVARQGWVRNHPWSVGTILVLLALSVSFVSKPEALSEWDHVYLRTAVRLAGGLDIYAFTEGYLYPPAMAWLSVPFTWLPPWGNRLAFFLLNAVCLLGLCHWGWCLSGGRALEGKEPVPRSEHLIYALGLLVGLRYSLDGLAHQQTDVILTALLIGGSLVLLQGRWLLAATCFGLVAGCKCTALLWCCYFVVRGRWWATGWLVLVALGINLLPELAYPDHPGSWRLLEWAQRYLGQLGQASYQPGTWGSALIYNQSLSGLLNRWFCTEWQWVGDILDCAKAATAWDPGHLKLLLLGVSLALLGLMACLWRCRHWPSNLACWERDALHFSSVLLLMVLLSPMSSKPHFATLLLPGFVLARLAVQRRSPFLWVVLAATILASLLGTRDLVGKHLAQLALWYGSVTWSALLLLAATTFILVRPARIRQAQPDVRPAQAA